MIIAAITPAGRRSMLKLAQRMTDNFCAGVCASTVHQWTKISTAGSGTAAGDDVRVMTRKSVDDPGEPPGVVLSAATSVLLPVTPQRLFEFLRDERLRSEWDILSNGGPMQEMAHIAKGQDPGNSVSLLRAGVCSLFPSHFFSKAKSNEAFLVSDGTRLSLAAMKHWERKKFKAFFDTPSFLAF